MVEVVRIRTSDLIIKDSYMILEVYCKEVIYLKKDNRKSPLVFTKGYTEKKLEI